MQQAKRGGSTSKERNSAYEFVHASMCYVLAAALAVLLIVAASPAELDPSTGEPLLWWQKSAQLFTWLLPWVLLASVAFAVPTMRWLRARAALPLSFVMAALVGCAPAVALFLLCWIIPAMRSQTALVAPFAFLGVIVSLAGFGLHVLVRRHLPVVLIAAGSVVIAGLVTSVTVG